MKLMRLEWKLYSIKTMGFFGYECLELEQNLFEM